MENNSLHLISMIRSIQGMESVVASVSGYHGTERFNLIKLISKAGASYVGTMSPSITHLVCREFKGRKYDIAKKLRTIIVNHQWIEDCIKQGKRVPEKPYMFESGKELGSLLLKVPITSEKGIFTTNCEVLTDRSKMCDDTAIEAINIFDGGSALARCTGSVLLNEHSEREKRKIFKHEESSIHTAVREMKKNYIGYGSTSGAKTFVKGRRLVKKNTGREFFESVFADSDEEWDPIRLRNYHNNVASPSNCSDAERRPDAGFNNHRENKNEDSEDVEEIEDWNCLSKDSKLQAKGTQSAMNGIRNGGCSDKENSNRESKDIVLIESVNISPTPMELSCVICWIEYSSTRGVLPCGHRFCFSCIQKWADSMASKGQISACPLCKAPFASITKVEDVATSDQKIYSQTFPCASSMTDIYILADRERPNFGAQSSSVTVCSECRFREPVDLLISCHLCQMRCIHSYCLDPPLLPWTCIHCKDLQMLYQHTSLD
ncbi:PTCB-BRCT domain-containing protein/zf-RING_2 domain-containing protein [Cephalotus follicularis]|uniref:PTCB-BRCT domain-containing protein/zf-RING_2 domain-containing protein n=1 Tax=Cephalotus follicularis TaxID=3775 RepID=A0A1Q3AWW8_CEPFO|nr:PTCB-BRCT domain-containing protein/zf-RING_2 domain-containing protein [Cephalotus follicularis]